MGQIASGVAGDRDRIEGATESLDVLVWNEAVKINAEAIEQALLKQGVRNLHELMAVKEALECRRLLQTKKHEFFASKHDLNNAGVVALSNFHCRILFRYNMAMIYINGHISMEQIVHGRTS